MTRLLLVLLAFELAGCAVVPKMEKVESGQQNVGASLGYARYAAYDDDRQAMARPADLKR